MATPDRDVYTNTDGTNRTVYTRENNSHDEAFFGPTD